MNYLNEAISVLAAIFELSGLWFLGSKKRLGFILNIVGGLLWILYVVLTKSALGLLLVCSVAFVLNTRGFRNWRKNNE